MSFKSNVPDIRKQFIKHPLLQSKVRISPSEAVGAAELAYLRGKQHGNEELEARAEKAEAEVERLFKTAWEARELMNLNDPEYAILSKALEPKT